MLTEGGVFFLQFLVEPLNGSQGDAGFVEVTDELVVVAQFEGIPEILCHGAHVPHIRLFVGITPGLHGQANHPPQHILGIDTGKIGFQVAIGYPGGQGVDHQSVAVGIEGDSLLIAAIEKNADYIKTETLTVTLSQGVLDAAEKTEEGEVNGLALRLSLRRVR